jgi:mercuric reductase
LLGGQARLDTSAGLPRTETTPRPRRLTEPIAERRSELMVVNAPAGVLEVGGMTCDDCARHVVRALTETGAVGVSARWRDGEAHFSWPEGSPRSARRGQKCWVPPGDAAPPRCGLCCARTGSQHRVRRIGARCPLGRLRSGDQGNRGRLPGRVGRARCARGYLRERRLCASKALLRAGELAWAARHNPFAGVSTSSGPVDLAALVAQKNQLVAKLRQVKYARWCAHRLGPRRG